MSEIDTLVERLRRFEWMDNGDGGNVFAEVLVNPDGPEAATTLTTLSLHNAKLVEAAKRALNFIENTESELGIKLESGDMLRQALNEGVQP